MCTINFGIGIGIGIGHLIKEQKSFLYLHTFLSDIFYVKLF